MYGSWPESMPDSNKRHLNPCNSARPQAPTTSIEYFDSLSQSTNEAIVTKSLHYL